MPRSRCHLALLCKLQERFRSQLVETSELVGRHYPDFVAGSVAPDGLRFLGQLDKVSTHFYEEGRKDTWGKSVPRMFATHPDLSDPSKLTEPDLAIIVGYISHLTVDEAFRDIVTSHVHGTEDWRPVIEGLWSLVDEIPVEDPQVSAAADAFSRADRIGFIDCEMVTDLLRLIRTWVVEDDPWAIEQHFLQVKKSWISTDEAREAYEQRRLKARSFLPQSRLEEFVEESIEVGFREVEAYLGGAYR